MKKTIVITVYLTCVITVLLLNFSFSKYTGSAKGVDNTKIANYSINLKTSPFSNNSTTLKTLGMGGGYSYYFYVTNQDNAGRISEVAINYKINMQTTIISGTTLEYKLYHSDNNKNRGSVVTLGTEILTIPVSKNEIIQYYELVVTGTAAPKGISTLPIKIVLNAEQKD